MEIRAKRFSGRAVALVLLIFGLQVPGSVSAQHAIIPLQLSFSDPGARSMGFGGAFVALADDATAAFSNPAGLVQLLEPEVSIEGRNWRHSTPFTVGGRLEGLPSGLGIDTRTGLESATSDYDVSGLSFLSIAYPKGNWSVSMFRHQYADLEFTAETQGFFTGGTHCCQVRQLDHRAISDLNILSHGLSAAYRVNDRIDFGLGVVHYETYLDGIATLFLPDDGSLPSILGRNSYFPERSVLSHRVYADDNDWAMTGGILWRLSESWSIGGVYRQGQEIKLSGEVIAGKAGDFGVPPGEVLFRQQLGLELPDIYGIGFAYRAPDGQLTASFQWDHIEYSNIPESLRVDDQTIDDVNEIHAGLEYVFLHATPVIAVRAGAWLDPDHQMRATADDRMLRALLPRGEDEIHYSAGLGISMQNFQIDLAVDFSDRVDTVSLSAIYSF